MLFSISILFLYAQSLQSLELPFTFQNLGVDYTQQLNKFINQHPSNEQQTIYKQLHDNLSNLQARIQQQDFRLSSFLQGLFAANGNYANDMWGGASIGIYNGNEVANGNVQVQTNDHVENNNRVKSSNKNNDVMEVDAKKSPVIVLLSQDEIRK